MKKQKLEQKICTHRRVPLKEECYSCDGLDGTCKDYNPKDLSCKYSEYCIKKKLDHLNFCSHYKSKTCKMAKEYEKYNGEDYNHLGVGS